MSTLEFWLAMAATAAGSPFLVEVFRALIRWRKGYTSKVAALEAALEEAQQLVTQLRQRKQDLKASHRDQLDDLHAEIRGLQERLHRLRLQIISLGEDPGEDA